MRPRDPEVPDPYKDILDNFDMLSAVKRCPKCGRLSLEYDARAGRLYCTKCDFSAEMPRQE